MMAAPQHDWADDFGLMLPSVNARFADEEEVVDQIDDIQDTIDELEQSINSLNQGSARTMPESCVSSFRISTVILSE